MKAFWNKVQQFMRDEEGVTAIEYALIAALIAVVIIAAATLGGNEVQNTFSQIGTALQGAGS